MDSPPGPEPPTILVAARDEADRIAETIAALRRDFPQSGIIVVDGDSTDATAERAEEAGAVVIRLGRRGKGEALSAGEQTAAPGPLLLCDADLSGSLVPLDRGGADLVVAAFTRRSGGGFGVAKRVAREGAEPAQVAAAYLIKGQALEAQGRLQDADEFYSKARALSG